MKKDSHLKEDLNNKPLFAEISLNLPLNRFFTYSVPENLQNQIKVGNKVFVTFKNQKKLLGVVVNLHSQTPSFTLKPILSLSSTPSLPSYFLNIAQFISDYYMCSINMAIHLFVHQDTLKNPTKARKTLENLPETINIINKVKLNPEQAGVYDQILKDSNNLKIFFAGLIFGITGSGKTEIYISLFHDMIKQQKQVLLLVPEIALTTQIIERFEKHFGRKNLGVIHSRQTPKEKREVLAKIARNEVKVILGPRSALFSPFKNLGLIIIDEEHDFSYKSQNNPRYHARHVAFYMAKTLNIPYLLGSATPSLEVYYSYLQKHLYFYQLTQRYHQTLLPEIELIDMNQEMGIFSKPLIQEIFKTSEKKEQSLLFINRRGYSPIVMCETCQHIKQCPDCLISLTYHKNSRELHCHYCGYKEPYHLECPQCHEPHLKPKGAGTEKVDEDISELFHQLTVLRMDKDTTQQKNKHQEILTQFKERKADILVGTQMITKGLDFSGVTLVGVLSCDTVLNLPDFRSCEYIFSLLTQVAGRSGRYKDGKVLIQTRYQNHYAVKYAKLQNYELFFQEEIKTRKQFYYPPFCKIIRFVVRSESSQVAEGAIDKVANALLKEFPNIKIFGPSICILQKIAKYYRYHFFIKVKNPQSYTAGIKKILKEFRDASSFYLEIDVDPISML